ncbi:hypothetical protein [Desulfovibrio sp. X2]|uniref:hypothetical protein n=1 Tax=Desulfovibrio sp. X2 TaxID=941449 RepID=UPI00191C5613|nr:hypothetical protein [Desulfovibrio sp. X2]
MGNLTTWGLAGTGLIILALAAACWWQGHTIKGLRADLTAAEVDVAVLKAAGKTKDAAIAALHAEVAARDAAIAKRDEQVARISTRRRSEQTSLKEATRNDPETRPWALEPVPAAVRRVLRQADGGDGAGGGAPDAAAGAAPRDGAAPLDR